MMRVNQLVIERTADESLRIRFVHQKPGRTLLELDGEEAPEFLLAVLRALSPRRDSYTADTVRAFLDEQPKCGVITIRGASS